MQMDERCNAAASQAIQTHALARRAGDAEGITRYSDRQPYILGCLLGTAVGDAMGLRREGLSRRRAARMYGRSPLTPTLALGLAFCSDDTEHTLMVTRALALSRGEPAAFQRAFARQLKLWLLTIPAGVGLATLRASIKLLVGFSPRYSGIYSAGNGPAMRAAILGVAARSEEELDELVRISTHITHTDPQAEEGARLVARAASLGVTRDSRDPVTFLSDETSRVHGDQLRITLTAAVTALRQRRSAAEFADSQGWKHGISGYVNQTVPAALYCWASASTNFRTCVENAVLLGGDTDTVAAIAGAVCGANLTAAAIPHDWIAALSERPRDTTWIAQLAESLASMDSTANIPPPHMHWIATLPRNILFAALVLTLGCRRLFPPY